jgi:hypothetical protein
LTLLVWAYRSLSALLCLWPISEQFAAAPASFMSTSPSRHTESALLLQVAINHGSRLLSWVGGCAVLYTVLSPLLTLAWLHAMVGGDAPIPCMRKAVADYRSGLGLLAIAAVAYVTLAAATALAFVYGVRLTETILAEDGLRIACGAVALSCALMIATAHDLSQAALVRHKRGILLSLHHAILQLSPRILAMHALLTLAIAAISFGADGIGRVDSSWLGSTASFALQQTLVLGTVGLRGFWLALTLQRIATRRES